MAGPASLGQSAVASRAPDKVPATNRARLPRRERRRSKKRSLRPGDEAPLAAPRPFVLPFPANAPGIGSGAPGLLTSKSPSIPLPNTTQRRFRLTTTLVFPTAIFEPCVISWGLSTRPLLGPHHKASADRAAGQALRRLSRGPLTRLPARFDSAWPVLAYRFATNRFVTCPTIAIP